MDTMRRFKLHGRSELKSILGILDSCRDAWSSAWFDDRVKLRSTLSASSAPENAPDSLGELSWFRLFGQKGEIYFAMSNALPRRLAESTAWMDIAHGGGNSEIWKETTIQCIGSFIKMLARQINQAAEDMAIHPLPAGPETAWREYGFGYLHYRLRLGESCIVIVISPEISQLILKPNYEKSSAPLHERFSLIVEKMFKVSVVAGTAEMTIGDLQSLLPGHVVRIDRLVGEALDLIGSEGERIGKGHLAASGSNKAIQMVCQ